MFFSEKQLFISNMNPHLIGRCVMMHFIFTAECKQVADIESGNKAYCQRQYSPIVLLWFHKNLINFTDLILENNLLLRSLPRGRKY